jgi:hypothetical protein
LTKGKEQETIIINRSGRSTYPEEKSVQTSGATPDMYVGGGDGGGGGGGGDLDPIVVTASPILTDTNGNPVGVDVNGSQNTPSASSNYGG